VANLATHLVHKGHAACGTPYYPQVTEWPDQVTCRRCMSTIHMADAEARLAVDPKKKTQRKEAR